MFLPPVFPLLVDALLFLTPSLYKLPKQQERRRKNTPFFVPFRSFHSWINTLQTVCNGTNGRLATLQRLNLPPCTLVSPSRDPRPPPQTHLQTPTILQIFFSKFLYYFYLCHFILIFRYSRVGYFMILIFI